MNRLLVMICLFSIGASLLSESALAQLEVETLPVRSQSSKEGNYIQTSAHPLDPASKPGKLAYLTGKSPYVSLYKFHVLPGERYTMRVEYKGDGKDGMLLLVGDNPLSDYERSYGPGDVIRRFWVHRDFSPGDTSRCIFAKVVNFTVSADSEHDSLWLIAYSSEPATGFGLYLWHPAVPDHGVLTETYEPCPGENWTDHFGRVEETPLWLSFDPSETKRRSMGSTPHSDEPGMVEHAEEIEDDFDFDDEPGEEIDLDSDEKTGEETDIDFDEGTDEEIDFDDEEAWDPSSESPAVSPPPTSEERVATESDACAFQTLSRWSGETEENYFAHITDDDNAYSRVMHNTNVPGAGKLRVTLRVSGTHEMSGYKYGPERYRAKVKLFSSESVIGETWLDGGEFYPGVLDKADSSRILETKGAGEVVFRLIPERCRVRTFEGELLCWVPTSTREPGIKLLPLDYALEVEYSPCR
jgi:hypothetical protein